MRNAKKNVARGNVKKRKVDRSCTMLLCDGSMPYYQESKLGQEITGRGRVITWDGHCFN